MIWVWECRKKINNRIFRVWFSFLDIQINFRLWSLWGQVTPTTRLLHPVSQSMGNCCSDVAGGQSAIGGTAAGHLNPANAPNDAVDRFLRSRGYNGLFSQIEVHYALSSWFPSRFTQLPLQFATYFY